MSSQKCLSTLKGQQSQHNGSAHHKYFQKNPFKNWLKYSLISVLSRFCYIVKVSKPKLQLYRTFYYHYGKVNVTL